MFQGKVFSGYAKQELKQMQHKTVPKTEAESASGQSRKQGSCWDWQRDSHGLREGLSITNHDWLTLDQFFVKSYLCRQNDEDVNAKSVIALSHLLSSSCFFTRMCLDHLRSRGIYLSFWLGASYETSLPEQNPYAFPFFEKKNHIKVFYIIVL